MIDRACISLNNNCNLRCRYCHFQDKQNNYSRFDKSEVSRIIENAHDYCDINGIRKFKLGIVGSGEPMLTKDVLFFIPEYIKTRKYDEFKMYTVTNGTLVTQEDLRKFYKYKDILNICFSLDGYEELHNYGRANYAETMRAIEAYKQIFDESPKINATVNSISIDNASRLINFFESHNLTDVTFSKIVGCFDKELRISDKEFADFLSRVKESRIKSRQFNQTQTYDCTMYGKLCGVGRTNIFITPEGIYPCGRFYKNADYRLGAFNQSFFDVEEKMKRFIPPENGKCFYEHNAEVK